MVHEHNYPTHDLELTTIFFTIKIFKLYSDKANYQIFTNHCSI